jgi:dethiobiotin synthetase/adenosylmethionine--8-amino-7-oxononanoate aminotransferase
LFGAQDTNVSNENDWQGLPVIFDEVFTGLFRLGHATAASLIQVHPDITVNAKLLTGGLLPLCTTLASNDIFETFLSAEKVDGLLHGHSYTAHPVGCAVAAASLDTFQKISDSGAWDNYKTGWNGEKIWSMWEKAFVAQVSHSSKVEGVFSLGTVLAINLKDDMSTGKYFVHPLITSLTNILSGYASNATEDFKNYLENNDTGSFSLHIRGLGNVIYVMTSQTIEPSTVRHIQNLILDYLKKN